MKGELLTEEQIRLEFRYWLVRNFRFGYQAADALCTSAPMVSLMKRGRKPLNRTALRHLGYEKVTMYRKVENVDATSDGCRAMQYGDRTACVHCRLEWDTNDLDPPACRRTT